MHEVHSDSDCGFTNACVEYVNMYILLSSRVDMPACEQSGGPQLSEEGSDRQPVVGVL